MISNKKRKRLIGWSVLVGIVLGVLFASQMNWITPGLTKDQATFRTDKPDVTLSENAKNTSDAFVAVSEELLPAVVNVATTKIVKTSQTASPFAPLLRDFFGRQFQVQPPEEQRLQGLGSGVIVAKEGYILTNHHVIANADDIKVTLKDKREYEATLVGTDPLTEIAVIKIKGDNLPVARLGDSDKMKVGEWVLAFGNPLYLTSTVTAGIVSAKGRNIGIIHDDNASEDGGSYAIENFIQTDAAINPGNSGGPLVNLNGEVIGINTAIASQNGGYQGYGFAVPMNLARKVMMDLINTGHVTRAWVGISMRAMTEKMAERFNLKQPEGVLIDQVIEDSPAAKAGLKSLDIILKMDGKTIQQSNQVQQMVALKNPGDHVTFLILRKGEEKTIDVTLGKRDTEAKQTSQTAEKGPSEIGLEVSNLTDQVASELGHNFYKKGEGVVVTGVEPYAAAAEAGIQPGDFIYKIEDQTIHSVSDFEKVIKEYKAGQVAIFSVKRQDRDFHAFVEWPKEK